MAKTGEECPLRLEQGLHTHAYKPRSGAKNQNEFAVSEIANDLGRIGPWRSARQEDALITKT